MTAHGRDELFTLRRSLGDSLYLFRKEGGLLHSQGVAKFAPPSGLA